MAKAYFERVEFHKFKAFSHYRLDLKKFNILVGPNNAGKSTIIAAFRILAAAMRRASARSADFVSGPSGSTIGYSVDLRPISVAEENIYYNYDDSEPATITFTLSNGNALILYFPEQGVCTMIPDAQGKRVDSPTKFRAHFDCQIGFVPILGPVEHDEPRFEKEAARLALFNYRAARNFRNIWFHYPEYFQEFRELLQQTWPGMDVGPPEVDFVDHKPFLYMYCPEKRIPREIFWAGFGFQVWCQMLTHVVQSKAKSIFLIDEPDIYLHSELQRQLLDILRNLGPRVVVATHSTEMITEANPDEIVIVDKTKPRAKRIQSTSSIGDVFTLLGSNLNPILTQVAKTRRVLFVEGKDFQVLGKIARQMGHRRLGNRSDFAVVPLEGFNPERMKNLKAGMEATLGGRIVACVMLDRDYRCLEEREDAVRRCKQHADFVCVHGVKEIENFLLLPSPLTKAISLRLLEAGKRDVVDQEWVTEQLTEIAELSRSYTYSQYLAEARSFFRRVEPNMHEAEVNQKVIDQLDREWPDLGARLRLISGKQALSDLNTRLQGKFGVNITNTGIVDCMEVVDGGDELTTLLTTLEAFTKKAPHAG